MTSAMWKSRGSICLLAVLFYCSLLSKEKHLLKKFPLKLRLGVERYGSLHDAFPTAQHERSAAGTASDIINLRLLLLLLLLHERSADFETVGVRRACLQDRW